MRIDDALRKRGFRRWYERQLIESHAYLVTGLLSLIMMAIALEMIAFRHSLLHAIALTAIELGGGALVVFSWDRFRCLLANAEALAVQAVCAQCRTYGRLQVIDAHDSEQTITGRLLTVRCRGCAHEWRMG
jgi:hypothetical protein